MVALSQSTMSEDDLLKIEVNMMLRVFFFGDTYP
jgi:hypothetical protein